MEVQLVVGDIAQIEVEIEIRVLERRVDVAVIMEVVEFRSQIQIVELQIVILQVSESDVMPA